MSDEIVHLALGSYTACQRHIIGGSLNWNAEGSNADGHGIHIVHTCLLENVTCADCKNTGTYKTMKEES